MIRSNDLFLKKALAAGLTITLTCSLLAGCGQNEPAKPEAKTETQETKEAGSPAPSDDKDTVGSSKTEEPVKLTNAKDAYLAFLKGEAKATAKIDMNEILKIGDSYTYSEICDFFEGSSADNYGELMKLNTASYAFVDCMKDGTQELAVQQYWGENGDVEMILLFTFRNGEITLAKKAEGSYRTSVSINKYGTIISSGSTGAMGYAATYETIDGEGNDLFLYDSQTDLSIARPIVPYYNIPESERPADYPEDDWAEEEGVMLCRDTYSFIPFTYVEGDENKEYYNNLIYSFYDENDTNVPADPEFADLYKTLGIRTCSRAEADQLISERLKSLGLDEDVLNFNLSPDWIELGK